MEAAQEPPFTRASLYTQRLWVNRFFVGAIDQLDERFAVRIGEAYAVGDGAHRR
jgi:hypothetical protein